MSVFNMKCYQGSIYARSQVNTLFKFNLDGGLIWSKQISGSITPNNVILTSPETSLEITPHGNIIFSQNCTGNYTYDGVTVNSGSGTFAIATLIDINSKEVYSSESIYFKVKGMFVPFSNDKVVILFTQTELYVVQVN